MAEETPAEMVQRPLNRPADCEDCGRRLRRGADALVTAGDDTVLCLECVRLDTIHTLGLPGAGARKEHERRRARHETRVRTAHPRLGGLILALSDDPAHVRAWQTGAVGEEAFGHRLSEIAAASLKVLHDRKLPGSRANIDHLAVTSNTIWVIDAKRYKGRVETRRHGLFSRRPPELFVGGRNQTKLVEGVKNHVDAVRATLEPHLAEQGVRPVLVRGALVFIDADFGLIPSPFAVDDVWVGWGRAIRKRLTAETDGPLPVAAVAKTLARRFRAGC